jgi:hypothetical protein
MRVQVAEEKKFGKKGAGGEGAAEGLKPAAVYLLIRDSSPAVPTYTQNLYGTSF